MLTVMFKDEDFAFLRDFVAAAVHDCEHASTLQPLDAELRRARRALELLDEARRIAVIGRSPQFMTTPAKPAERSYPWE